MPAPEQVLYATPAMRSLLRAEAALLRTLVPARAGSYGLYLGVQDDTDVCAQSVARWVRFRAGEVAWRGPVHARKQDALPFLDGSFSVVLVSHVQQYEVHARHMLREAIRVLAPGGTLVLTGMHPFSIWAPWMNWCLRGSARTPRLRTPLQWLQGIGSEEIDIHEVRRFGRILPRAAADDGAGSRYLGGGFAMLARKHRAEVTPLRFARLAATARGAGSLAPGAHRECA